MTTATPTLSPITEYIGILPKADYDLFYSHIQAPCISERHYQLNSNTYCLLTESKDLSEELYYGLYLFSGTITRPGDTDYHNCWTNNYYEVLVTDKPFVALRQLEKLLQVFGRQEVVMTA